VLRAFTKAAFAWTIAESGSSGGVGGPATSPSPNAHVYVSPLPVDADASKWTRSGGAPCSGEAARLATGPPPPLPGPEGGGEVVVFCTTTATPDGPQPGFGGFQPGSADHAPSTFRNGKVCA
jgi:hypothetical protein